MLGEGQIRRSCRYHRRSNQYVERPVRGSEAGSEVGPVRQKGLVENQRKEPVFKWAPTSLYAVMVKTIFIVIPSAVFTNSKIIPFGIINLFIEKKFINSLPRIFNAFKKIKTNMDMHDVVQRKCGKHSTAKKAFSQ